MSTRFFLVRHGQTDWNKQRRYQGQKDIPLNQMGLAQAYQIALSFTNQPFDALYSSDLRRAFQTATEISKVVGLPIQLDDRLREIHQGDWEGRLIDDVFLHDPTSVDMVYAQPHSTRRPGGESIADLAQRIQNCLRELNQRHNGGRVIIVSHGLAIATAICAQENHPLSKAREFIPDNCQVTTIQLLR